MTDGPAQQGASLRGWLSVFGCMVGALIAVLDIQITNSSLPQIEGGIGTGSDNGTWISTSYLIGEIEYNSRITVRACCQVVDGGGDGRLEWLGLRDVDTGQVDRVPAYGLFLLLGAEPHCDWLPPEVARDERGFVLTGRDVPRDRWHDGLPPENLATTVPGVFAAGDVRAGSMKRVASASGEGASVVPLVHTWLAPAPE